MSDLIERQMAIDAVQGIGRLATLQDNDAVVRMSAVEYVLFNLPSAQQEQRWIPVSERMPEPRIDVWCNSDMGQMVGYYDEYAETWYGRDYLELIVTAWMPLPEPYREERTDE